MSATTLTVPRDLGLRRALAMSSGGTATARLTGAIGGVLAARLLGPSGRGQLAVLVFVAALASMAAAAGIQFWIARETAQSKGITRVSWVVRIHLVVALSAVSAVLLVLSPGIASLAAANWVTVMAAALFAVSAAANLLLLALPNGMRSMGLVALATSIAGAIYVSGVAALLGLGAASVALVLTVAAAGNLTACVVVFVWARRTPPGTEPELRGFPAYRAALRFGLPAGAGELVLLAMLRIDVVILAAFLPLRQVGLYAVATALAEVLWIIPDGVAQVVLPTTAREPAESQTAKLLGWSCLVTMLAGVGLVLVAPELITGLFGAAFRAAADAVPLLVVASLAGGIWKIVGAEVVARGVTMPRLTSAIVGLVVMVAVDLLAVPGLGIVGAALGSACGYTAAAAVVSSSWVRSMR